MLLSLPYKLAKYHRWSKPMAYRCGSM